MKITRHGHSCLLIESEDARIIIDPGNFSSSWHDLVDLDAIFITHHHADHIDPDHFGYLRAKNPTARICAERQVADVIDLDEECLCAPGEQWTIGDLRIRAIGGEHAVIHADYPSVGNIGFLISDGRRTVLHPGDNVSALVDCPVDLLAVPAYGPWAAVKETIDYVRAINPRFTICIHDGLLNERGRSLIAHHITALTSTQVIPVDSYGSYQME